LPSTVVNGWLHTGDLGRTDPAGAVTAVDRLKELAAGGG
jgi:long-subunit acyl-CoA synthetase (AMP-forming)